MIPARIKYKNRFGDINIVHGSFIRHGEYYTIFRFGLYPIIRNRNDVIDVRLINLNH